MKSRCITCKTLFECDSSKSCWCTSFPPILRAEDNALCFCPECLLSLVQNKISQWATDPSKRTEIANLGLPANLIKDVDYSVNKNGLMVFTAWYLLRRGYCCENDCRHCPY